jgi:spermidine/putrescine transport system permease protein
MRVPIASARCNALHLLPGQRPHHRDLGCGRRGLTYNFLPFMVLPIYASLERADPKIIEAGGDLYANGLTTFRTGDPADVDARCACWHTADLHPSRR